MLAKAPREENPGILSQDLIDLTEGGGAMGMLIRDVDWDKTAVGVFSSWPQSLKTALSICLGSRFPMFVWWGQELTVFYNDAYIPFTGQKHPKYLGRSAREQWSEIWHMLEPLTEQVLKTGKATWAESMLLFMERKGFLEETYFTFSYSPVCDESGAVGGIINPCQETTEQILSHRRLKTVHSLASHETQGLFAVGASAALALSSNANDIPFALIYLTDNSMAALIGDYGVKPRLASTKIDLVDPSADHWQLGTVNQAKTPFKIAGLRARFAADLPHTPFEEGPDAAYVMPIILRQQEHPAGFLILGISPRLEFDSRYEEFFCVICSQVTTLIGNANRLEDERHRTEAMAEINKAKTAFFTNVSHEFRTPLTLMLGPVEDLLFSVTETLSQEARSELAIVHRNALRLLKLVDILLDFSAIESDRLKAHFEATDLAKLTVELASSFASATVKADLDLRIDCPDLKEFFYVDQMMWEKICLNLISNAFKFTLKGSIKISLRLLLDWAELEVSDTGIGIPAHEQLKVFERFHRISGSRGRSYEGTGIGLSLVKELVQLQSGTIDVQSEIDQGTTFKVRIPRGKEHLPKDYCDMPEKTFTPSFSSRAYVFETAVWNENPKDTPASSPDGEKRKRILLADDNADMRGYMQRLLANHWDVEVVCDGLAALASIKKATPDLIVSDVMMPNLDGYSFLKAVRENPETQTIPFIMLSAAVEEGARVKGLLSGADDYLIKPFSAREFIARVQAALATYSLRQESMRREALEKFAKKLAESKALLEQTNEELSTFAYIAAHDLREPLRGIHSFSELISREYGTTLGDQGKSWLDLICGMSKRMSQLLDSLMGYARLGNSDLNLESIDLNRLVREEVAIFKVSHPEYQHADFKAFDLPQIMGDRVMMRQVFANLMSNAMKYNNSAEKRVEIGYENAAIYVKDNGLGIDEADYAAVFQIFKRLHQADAYGGGSGAGLTIVKKIIERHRGKIWLDSRSGQGTCFYFTLNLGLEA